MYNSVLFIQDLYIAFWMETTKTMWNKIIFMLACIISIIDGFACIVFRWINLNVIAFILFYNIIRTLSNLTQLQRYASFTQLSSTFKKI